MITLKRLTDIRYTENQNEENCLFAIIKSKGEYIKYIDDSNLNEDLVKLAIKINGKNIRFIPDKYKTKEINLMAAITGAPLSLLTYVDQDIENIVKFVYEHKESLKDIGKNIYNSEGLKRTVNICINGYWTNVFNRFSLSLIEDNPRFMQYYINNGFMATRRPGGPIYFVDGKMLSYNSKIDGYKFEFQFNPSFIYKNGKIDISLALRAVKRNNYFINYIEDKDLTCKFLESCRDMLLSEKYNNNIDSLLSRNMKASAELFSKVITLLSYDKNYNKYIEDNLLTFWSKIYNIEKSKGMLFGNIIIDYNIDIEPKKVFSFYESKSETVPSCIIDNKKYSKEFLKSIYSYASSINDLNFDYSIRMFKEKINLYLKEISNEEIIKDIQDKISINRNITGYKILFEELKEMGKVKRMNRVRKTIK